MYRDNIERLLFVYGAQVLLALIIAILFFHFFKSYNRNLLKWWSYSWISYAGIYISSAFILFMSNTSIAAFLILLFSYSQVLLLIIGVCDFLERVNDGKLVKIGFIIVLILTISSFFLYYADPEASNERYIIRVGIKSILVSAGFFWVGFKILSAKAFLNRFSKYFLVSAFLLYAIQQLWFASIVFLNVAGFDSPFPINSFGIVDLFSISVIGIGMIVWLLENERALLRQANQDLDNFLYSTSHDLRAPLASILGLTNLGRLETKDPTAKEYLNKIESRVNTLDGIVGDILNYSKSTKIPITKSKIEFEEFVQTIFDQLKFASDKKEISLKLQNDSISYFFSDENQLGIVLNNLLSNAIKYRDPLKEEHWIHVTLRRDKALIRIIIEDNGIGIDPDNLSNIFSMFFRATNVGEGSGLGLYIASEAIKKLKGDIEVESNLGEGSTFTIILNENWI